MFHPGGYPVRSGCDLQPVDDVRSAVAAFGDRYLSRVYTVTEQADAAGRPERLAGRWAAKEAVLKLLGSPDGIDPRCVEVRTGSSGRPELVLHGPAARLAAEQGIGPIDVSLSTTTDLAMAVAVAPTTTPTRGTLA